MQRDPLLVRMLDAHGGAARWARLRRISATAAIGGALWADRGQSDALRAVRVDADPHQPLVRYAHVGADDRQVLFAPPRVITYDRDGHTLDCRADARAVVAARRPDAPWDLLDLAYVAGSALWTDLALPFLLDAAGIAIEPGAPWFEAGERWQRLHVRVPPRLHSHGVRQTVYVDRDGLLRRHDFDLDVLGGATCAQYLHGHAAIDGLVLATRRRAYARQHDNHPDRSRLVIATDLQAPVLH